MVRLGVMVIRRVVIPGEVIRGLPGKSFSCQEANDGRRNTAKCKQETAPARVEHTILDYGAIATVSRIPHDLVFRLLAHVGAGHTHPFTVLRYGAKRMS